MIWVAIRTYAPYVVFPVAAVIGFVGYHMEGLVSDRYTPYKKKSIEEEREERQLLDVADKDCTQVDSLKEKKFVPRTMLDKNLSPSLQTKPS